MGAIRGDMTAASTKDLWLAIPAFSALALFLWLGRQVALGRTQAWDAALREAIHSRASGFLTAVMKTTTQLGSTYVVIPAGLVAVWRLLEAGRARAAVVLALAAAGAEIFGQLLKLAILRRRPAPFFGLAEPFAASFPSTHAMVSACFYGPLAAILAARSHAFLVKAGVWLAAAALALAVGFSRVYLGVHYPSDALGGYAGAVVWLCCLRMANAWWKRPGPRPK